MKQFEHLMLVIVCMVCFTVFFVGIEITLPLGQGEFLVYGIYGIVGALAFFYLANTSLKYNPFNIESKNKFVRIVLDILGTAYSIWPFVIMVLLCWWKYLSYLRYAIWIFLGLIVLSILFEFNYKGRNLK